MARAVVSKEDVIRAASEIEAKGGDANSNTVFEALGRKGSYSTILRYLREWRTSRPAGETAAVAAIPPKAEEALAAGMRSVWTLAHGFAQEEIAQVKTAADQRIHAADLQRIDAEEALAQVERENEILDEAKVGLEKRVSRLEQELSAKEALRHDAEQRLTAAEQKIAGLETEIKDASGQLSAIAAQFAAARERNEQASAQIHALTQKDEEAMRALVEEQRQVQNLTGELKRRQDESAAAAASAKEEAQRANRLEVELAKVQSAVQELRQRLEADQGRLDSLLRQAKPK